MRKVLLAAVVAASSILPAGTASAETIVIRDRALGCMNLSTMQTWDYFALRGDFASARNVLHMPIRNGECAELKQTLEVDLARRDFYCLRPTGSDGCYWASRDLIDARITDRF